MQEESGGDQTEVRSERRCRRRVEESGGDQTEVRSERRFKRRVEETRQR